jgi:DNA-3-methyladenine glycosylase
MGAVLTSNFYARPTLEVARNLIGKVLLHRVGNITCRGVIVEVEAYIGEADPACHAAAGLTERNAPLYGAPGCSYVYLNYGIHCLFNVVTEPEGFPAAVLIRALEPLEGVASMRRRRTFGISRQKKIIPDSDLCRGPGNLTRACGITLRQNRLDLRGSHLCVEDSNEDFAEVAWTTRVGIRVGEKNRWRCFVPKHSSVSMTAHYV